MSLRPAPALLALLLATAATAQEPPIIQLPAPTPTETPTPRPLPSSLSTPTPTPSATVTPRPRATPTPRPTPSAAPTPRPTPSATPVPAPTATPTAVASPVATPTPQPARTPEPIETVVLPQQRAAAPLWPWLAGAGALALLALGWAVLRRRGDDEESGDEPLPEPAAEPELAPPLPSPGRVTLALRPLRAGLNLISATAECEVTVANSGETPVEDVRVALELTSAREGQGDGLAAFFAAPVGRPAVPAFALAPGEERTFRTVAALPHDAIHALDAGGRPMFVPLLALSAHYRADGASRRVGHAFAVGVERVDSAKLGPFWLDTPPRLYDTVAARPHGEAVEG